MTATVPRVFPFPSRTGVASGKPVRSVHMTSVSRALNYLQGRGAVLLPATRVEGSPIAIGGTKTYHVELFAKAPARYRVWHIRPQVYSTGWVRGTFTDPSGGTLSFDILESADPAHRPINTGLIHVETVDSPRANGPTASSFTLASDAASTGTLLLESVACYELPRDTLELASDDLGHDTDTVRVEMPIFADDYLSVGGLARIMPSAQLYDPRVLFAHIRASGDGIEYKSNVQASIFDEGPVVQPSHQFSGETLREVVAYVYAYCDVGTAGTVKFSAASGDSVTISIVATTGTWVSGFFDCYAEDLSTSDGRRASTDEIVTILAQRTSGAGSIYIETIMLAETRT